MGRWSKRFDVKVVPRRYLHLYRCFGWTPTSPTATPQYDWERSPNSPGAYTSADISANLQDYDDLGLQRKELVAIKRNTKFFQYRERYPAFFRAEKTFDTLMNRYTVGKNNKIIWVKQLFYHTKKSFDLVWSLLCLVLLLGLVFFAVVPSLVPDLGIPADFLSKYITKVAESDYRYIPFFVFAAFFLILSLREIWVRGKALVDMNFNAVERYYGNENGPSLLETKMSWRKCRLFLVTRNYICILLSLFAIFLGLYALGVIPSLRPMTNKEAETYLVSTLYVYAVMGLLIHFRAFLNANPYAVIKWLCLRARPVTKKILMGDMSMMSPQQRQRYQQGRIISSAVSDAMDRRDKGIKDDFYIGY